jgi:hypothetical protein
VHPAQAPVSFRHADSPEKWAAALARAKVANVKVYDLGHGRYAVTSAHDPSEAYEVTVIPQRCACPTALSGDPACLHRAIVRDLRNRPEPPTPATVEIDQAQHELEVAEAYQRTTWDLLPNLQTTLDRDGRLGDRDFERLLRLEQRELDEHDRVLAARERLSGLWKAQNATVAA